MSELATIAFAIPKDIHARISERARSMSLGVPQYARRLFEAAYLCRIGQERGDEPSDQKLDRQVREVFLMADAEPEFIAEALGLPQARVEKIIAGWQQVATERPAQAHTEQQEEVADAEPVANSTTRTIDIVIEPKGTRWSSQTIAVVVKMWSAGKSTREIADAIGRSRASLEMWLSKHRDLCPKRRG